MAANVAPLGWLTEHLAPRETNAAEFWYDRMDSQSGRRLYPMYVPFEPDHPGHFTDRGQILDYRAVAGGGRILDFGPGDGWPSLLLAPMVGEVVGVDGSARRVEVCAAHAARLGLGNARFVHVPPGAPLPFADGSFDGVVAGASVEQTPDPQATLRELARVLRPGGRLRLHYESLGYYRGGRERDLWLNDDDGACRLVVVERDVEAELARHVGLVFDRPAAEVTAWLGAVTPEALTADALGDLARRQVAAVTWTTRHPSARTLLRWLPEAGFASAAATWDGGWFARRLFARLGDERPRRLSAIDALLRPLVEVVVTMPAPLDPPPGQWDPWVTGVR